MTDIELTKEEILVSNPWKVDNLQHVIFGKFSEYSRGGENITGIEYDNLEFRFYSEGTGLHIEQFENSIGFVWKFISGETKPPTDCGQWQNQ